ncbi:GNAT family N-acetyltransferase [Streptomyces sp. NPDC056683]|uniref:GNAT family N-acetyltransferase n=1 Tax=Streptomyces sp. NPDC056683 TaxID=3345910 RepID=UPI00368137EA
MCSDPRSGRSAGAPPSGHPGSSSSRGFHELGPVPLPACRTARRRPAPPRRRPDERHRRTAGQAPGGVRRRGRVLAQAALERPIDGVGLIRSVTVAPYARGHGLGLGLLGNALDVLTGLGAREAIVYLDELPADLERDPIAALRMYAASDFTEVDQLLTFTRTLAPRQASGRARSPPRMPFAVPVRFSDDSPQ